MYKITLYDHNSGGIADWTVCFFTDDIEDFQARWFHSRWVSEETKERFLRSKAGEMVTDYWIDSPDLNIVQQDEAVVFAEKKVVLSDVTFGNYISHMYGSEFYVKQWDIHFKWIKFKKEYFRIASYKAEGVCRFDHIFVKRWESIFCYGNPVLENTVVYDPKYSGRVDESLWDNPTVDDFKDNHVETICFLTNAVFKTKRKMEKDIADFKVTGEVMDRLFDDVAGQDG